jgi:hypothetical protein
MTGPAAAPNTNPFFAAIAPSPCDDVAANAVPRTATHPPARTAMASRRDNICMAALLYVNESSLHSKMLRSDIAIVASH